jgi:hypothetical protein
MSHLVPVSCDLLLGHYVSILVMCSWMYCFSYEHDCLCSYINRPCTVFQMHFFHTLNGALNHADK